MSLPGEDKKLTVCLYISGEHSRAGMTLLDTLFETPGLGKTWELLVAVDAPSYDIKHLIQRDFRHRKKAVFLESTTALGKERWWRVMMANMRSEYALLLDQEAHVSPSWVTAILDYTRDNPNVGICGFRHATPPQGSGPYQSPLKSGVLLIKTSFYREHEILPPDKIHVIGSQAAFFDFSMAATLGVFPDSMQQLKLSEVFSHDRSAKREDPITPKLPIFSVCICTYGDHPELILRCLDSIIKEPILKSELEVIVGCNDVSDEVMDELERRYRDGLISTLIRSPVNYNKAGMQRFMFRLARAPYVLSLDDDMYFKDFWSFKMKEQILATHPFEAAGRLHALSNRTLWSGQKKPYDTYCQKKRWWRGKRPYGLEVVFPAGQCFLVRTQFAIENDYPDLDMRIDWDDVLLGDLVIQLDGKQNWFKDELIELIVVDDIPSRGKHGGG